MQLNYCSITAITTRDTYQVMMNVQNFQTFAPTVVQSGEDAEQLEHVSDTDTYTDDDYAHTYELEPEGHTESRVY